MSYKYKIPNDFIASLVGSMHFILQVVFFNPLSDSMLVDSQFDKFGLIAEKDENILITLRTFCLSRKTLSCLHKLRREMYFQKILYL